MPRNTTLWDFPGNKTWDSLQFDGAVSDLSPIFLKGGNRAGLEERKLRFGLGLCRKHWACSLIKDQDWDHPPSINHSSLDGYFKYLAEIVLIWVSAVFSSQEIGLLPAHNAGDMGPSCRTPFCVFNLKLLCCRAELTWRGIHNSLVEKALFPHKIL